MNTHSNHVAGSSFDRHENPPAMMSATRPLYWSVRRELWENRSVYIAPLAVAAFVLFGCFMATLVAGSKGLSSSPSTTGKQRPSVVTPISMAPAPIMFTTFLVGLFYSFDALYGERRDRSILFWKSLPVSDLTTVLSKASIPLVVLPLIGFALSAVTQFILLPVTIFASMARGGSAEQLWALLPEPVVMIYGLSVHALWFAPIYCWLLLVSAWARAPLLWAVLPLLVVSALERMMFNSWHFMSMLQYRMTGAMKEAFAHDAQSKSSIIRLSELTPLNFLSTPGLWVGLIFAAACLVAAVRLRRNREPI